MEIKIDENVIQEALNKEATGGIKASFEGYAFKKLIEEAVQNTILPNIMSNAILDAASKIDVTVLAHHLATEMSKAITRGVVQIMRDVMIEIIMRVRKVPDYDDNKRAQARMEIIASVFKDRTNEDTK